MLRFFTQCRQMGNIIKAIVIARPLCFEPDTIVIRQKLCLFLLVFELNDDRG